MSTELTLEQKFELQRMKNATDSISREQTIELLESAHSLVFIKEKNLNRMLKEQGQTIICCQLNLEHQLSLQVKQVKWQEEDQETLIEELVETMTKLMLTDNALREAFKGNLQLI